MKFVTVGAGPCGLHVSQLLLKQGHEVTILEEHDRVGAPIYCAGLVGKKLADKFGSRYVINNINGAHIFLNDTGFFLKRKNVAFVLDRCGFDRSFATDIPIEYDQRVVSVAKDASGKFHVKTPNSSICADAIIGADGPVSIVRKSLAMKSSIRYFLGCQQRIRAELEDEHMVIVDINQPFFSWAIPEGNGIVRVGAIGSMKGVDAMREKFDIRGEVIDSIQAPIPIGRAELFKDGAFLLGDAAAQTKPTTGGGLYYGLRGAELLAKAVGEGAPERYQKYWNKEFGREIRLELAARRLYEHISKNDLSLLFSVLMEKKEYIEAEADFEKHSTAIKTFLLNPKTLSVIMRNLKLFLR